MKKVIKLPSPQLSQLKEVNIELNMTGRHYSDLATAEGNLPEELVLSILKDLVEEDADLLTMNEARYLFMLVKINALENNYTARVSCTHKKKDGKTCGCKNEVKILLSDADLNVTPKNYKVPEIDFVVPNENGISESKKYKVMPPTLPMEIALTNWFFTEKNVSPEQIETDKAIAQEFTFARAVLHLMDKNGNRVINDMSDFGAIDSYLDVNTFQSITQLFDKVTEVESYGVQNKVYTIKCKECGGTLVFQLPILHGLIM